MTLVVSSILERKGASPALARRIRPPSPDKSSLRRVAIVTSPHEDIASATARRSAIRVGIKSGNIDNSNQIYKTGAMAVEIGNVVNQGKSRIELNADGAPIESIAELKGSHSTILRNVSGAKNRSALSTSAGIKTIDSTTLAAIAPVVRRLQPSSSLPRSAASKISASRRPIASTSATTIQSTARASGKPVESAESKSVSTTVSTTTSTPRTLRKSSIVDFNLSSSTGTQLYASTTSLTRSTSSRRESWETLSGSRRQSRIVMSSPIKKQGNQNIDNILEPSFQIESDRKSERREETPKSGLAAERSVNSSNVTTMNNLQLRKEVNRLRMDLERADERYNSSAAKVATQLDIVAALRHDKIRLRAELEESNSRMQSFWLELAQKNAETIQETLREPRLDVTHLLRRIIDSAQAEKNYLSEEMASLNLLAHALPLMTSV